MATPATASMLRLPAFGLKAASTKVCQRHAGILLNRRGAASESGEPEGKPPGETQAPRSGPPTAEEIAKLRTTFGRASIAARLMQSRLALPIAYPLNPRTLSESKARLGDPGDVTQNKELQKGLAHVMPLVVGMAKVAPMLRASQALSHYQGSPVRSVAPDEETRAEEDDVRLDFIRPQRWRGRSGGHIGGVYTNKVGNSFGWEDAGSGRTVDSHVRRFTLDPWDDTPRLHRLSGKEYVSPTKWDKRKSG
eukprot:CAMPEP_0206456092 /NCGR_PEP_ID=MMETSP0324_2-20121206/22161_1 /ASSEMBLY_ACC=CAM_ASM_000836 /TAXON_ID=2866 /ORGANISM="Crypthecodinium cohnii, Strain Seligo" /LENGTH=249 /DNA_ID=CAMNT_0053926959 /DNA_START=94 /DNA_END=840 /DNA_ORIENTATION=+